MKRHGTRVLLFAVFGLTLCAGVVAGLLASRLPARPGSQSADLASLADTLKLTADQRVQMRSIWENMRDVAHDCKSESQKLDLQHEDELQALIPEGKKEQYRKIEQAYSDRRAALKVRQEGEFDKAVERTKKMLNPEQRTTYEQVLRAKVGREPTPPRAAAVEQVAMPEESGHPVP
jgi:Spy/CpxP family protein refolding chaperone